MRNELAIDDDTAMKSKITITPINYSNRYYSSYTATTWEQKG